MGNRDGLESRHGGNVARPGRVAQFRQCPAASGKRALVLLREGRNVTPERMARARASLAALESAITSARVSDSCRAELERAAQYERAFIELNEPNRPDGGNLERTHNAES